MQSPSKNLRIAGRNVGENEPTYFIADIAANHDGDLERAKDLIFLAKEAGADAAKFQHFKAESIVSDRGFNSLSDRQSHQSSWEKSVFEVYKDATVDLGWSATLKETCDKAGITFFTSPYAFDLVDHIDAYVPAYKIGSGDITWIELIEYIAGKNKPYILASGASTLDEVKRAVSAALVINPQLALLQCNTNYTASLENFKYIQLNVLKTYRKLFPDMILGLSDHTPGHSTVLGAVALGARIVEKHFTDNISRVGPDHKFSMDPESWREMVIRTRELEAALGCGIKKVEENELETLVVQRRAIRMVSAMDKGSEIKKSDLIPLRPCPSDGIPPDKINELVGRRLARSLPAGELIKWTDLE
ncbi:MAG: N-acetylneuraminate synthase family protein [Betaproteobacteria bacterium]